MTVLWAVSAGYHHGAPTQRSLQLLFYVNRTGWVLTE